MAEYLATITWHRHDSGFTSGKYSREHTWIFDGGITIPASPSPHVVPAPWSNAKCVDPEEAYVATISSCHMLTFLWLAAKAGFTADSYTDPAVGTMTKNDHGIPWVSKVVLHPVIEWSGEKLPTQEEEAKLHEESHHHCFIANSVKTQIVVE